MVSFPAALKLTTHQLALLTSMTPRQNSRHLLLLSCSDWNAAPVHATGFHTITVPLWLPKPPEYTLSTYAASSAAMGHQNQAWLQRKSRECAAARRATMNEEELAAHRTLHNAHAAAYRQRNRRVLRHNASEYRRQKKAAREAAEERERLEIEIAELEAQV
ncbi:hypothetical protein H0H92_013923 [Tricholoma furcatifolium]|nr:hypothetical protein H0H92_013923 [Tricholoma furcatifolium]